MSKNTPSKYQIKDLMQDAPKLLETDFSALCEDVFEFVYRPGDDSYLMLHTVLRDLRECGGPGDDSVILEVG